MFILKFEMQLYIFMTQFLLSKMNVIFMYKILFGNFITLK